MTTGRRTAAIALAAAAFALLGWIGSMAYQDRPPRPQPPVAAKPSPDDPMLEFFFMMTIL